MCKISLLQIASTIRLAAPTSEREKESSTKEWQMLMDSVLIPDEWMAMAYARLTELTVQELEVS